MLDVIFYEVFAEEKDAIRRYLPARRKAAFVSRTIQESGHRTPRAGLVSIRTQSRIPESWLPQLQGVLTRSTGYDHIAAFLQKTQAKIPCGFLPPYCSRAVAEQAILMLLALFRKLPAQQQAMATFCRDGLSGREARGRNCLVVGVGNIGREVVCAARGLGMNVKGVDIVRREKGLGYVTLAQGLAWADAVVCACPLTPKTDGMVRYGLFRGTRKRPVLVNVARGEITPADDLRRLLIDGKISGLGMDVYPEEDRWAASLRGRRARPLPAAGQLMQLIGTHNVIFTPHNAFNSNEATERKARLTAEAVELFFKHRRFPAQVPLK